MFKVGYTANETFDHVGKTKISRVYVLGGFFNCSEELGQVAIMIPIMERTGLAHNFQVLATADDGIIEAFQATDGEKLLAIQWDPEVLADQQQTKIFKWLEQA